jgi:hypothetical protein
VTPVENLRSKLKRVKTTAKGFTARCPAHDDQTPSLSVNEGDDGRALVKCHAGCTTEAVMAAVGLEMRDLMPMAGRLTPGHISKKNAAKPHGVAFPTAKAAVAKLVKQHGKYTGRWTYQDAAGEPVGVVLRWNLAEGKKTIRPVSRFPDGWRIEAMPEPRPLYRLPDVLKADRTLVTEGELCADEFQMLGFTATTSVGGCGAAGKTNWQPLAGKEVWILPDNDAAGRKYASEVANILAGLSPAARVKVVELPGLPDAGDIVDWVEAHGEEATPDALRAEIESLAARTAIGAGPILLCLADVTPEDVRWLWPHRIPLGRLTIVVGRPGEGKSFFTMDLAARVSRGRAFPDRSGCPAGSVIIVSAEDNPADTIRPRLDACEADVVKVFVLSGVRYTAADGDRRERAFTLADIGMLEAALRAQPDCKLVVIDPIGSYLGAGTDAHRDNEVRAVLSPLAGLADRFGVAVVLVAHRRKSSGDCADDGVLGSRAFTGLARAVWHLSRDPDDKARRLLLPGKNNLTPEGDGLAFRIEGKPGRIVWEDGPVEMTADDAVMFEARAAAESRKPGPVAEARKKAAKWLEEVLAGGPRPPAELKERAVVAGHKWRTVERAADDLGIARDRGGFGEGSRWQLRSTSDVAIGDRAGDDGAEQARQVPEKQLNLATWRDRENLAEITRSDHPSISPAKLSDSGGNEANREPLRSGKLNGVGRTTTAKVGGATSAVSERRAENDGRLFADSRGLPD